MFKTLTSVNNLILWFYHLA